MSRIIQNAAKDITSNTYYQSTHVHHYVSIVCDGENYFIDGGQEYLRRNFINNDKLVDWSLYEGDSYDLIKARLLWGTYGINGDQPKKWIPLSECTTDHLKAILRTQTTISNNTRLLIEDILNDRGIKTEHQKNEDSN